MQDPELSVSGPGCVKEGGAGVVSAPHLVFRIAEFRNPDLPPVVLASNMGLSNSI